MIVLKRTLATMLVGAALFSGAAFANSSADAKVRAAGEGTVTKTQEAVDLLEKGGSKEEVLKFLAMFANCKRNSDMNTLNVYVKEPAMP